MRWSEVASERAYNDSLLSRNPILISSGESEKVRERERSELHHGPRFAKESSELSSVVLTFIHRLLSIRLLLSRQILGQSNLLSFLLQEALPPNSPASSTHMWRRGRRREGRPRQAEKAGRSFFLPPSFFSLSFSEKTLLPLPRFSPGWMDTDFSPMQTPSSFLLLLRALFYLNPFSPWTFS